MCVRGCAERGHKPPDRAVGAQDPTLVASEGKTHSHSDGYLSAMCDLMHMELPTQLKHITQWRKLKQPRLLQ